MKVNKAIKKIAALGLGASLFGATILGAMAADLSAYPKPMFIGEDGTFNGVLVVGHDAASMDTIGVADIKSALQATATREVVVSSGTSGTTATVTGEGWKIDASSKHMTLNQSLNYPKSVLSEDQLPNLLGKGTYVADGDDGSESTEYDQELRFNPAVKLTYYQDDDYDEDSPHIMVFTPSGTELVNYTMAFTKTMQSDVGTGSGSCGDSGELCDFEDTKLTIMGLEYDITDATQTSAKRYKLDLMGGSTTNTLFEGESAKYTVGGETYEVTVDIISDNGGDVVLSVNGEASKALSAGQTDNVAGVTLGIKEVMSNEAQEELAGRDMVKFYLGAKKLTIDDTTAETASVKDNYLQLDGDDVEELYGDLVMTNGTKVSWTRLLLFWVPDDDVFVTEDASATFPGLESFSLSFAGMDKNTESIKIKPKGNTRVELQATLESGDCSFDILYTDGTSYTAMGNSATPGNKRLITAIGGTVTAGDYIVASVNSSGTGETRILEFDRVSKDGEVRLKDVCSGSTYTKSNTSGTATFDIGSVSLSFTVVTDGNPDTVKLNAGDVDRNIYTASNAVIRLPAAATYGLFETAQTSFNITIDEEDTNGNAGGADGEIAVNVSLTSDGKTTVSSITPATAIRVGPDIDTYYYDVGDSDVSAGYTEYGTYFKYDYGGTQDYVELDYSEDEAYGQIFVNAAGATVSNAASGEVTTIEVVPIPVTATKTDDEVADVTAVNAIVVGGPCRNSAAGALMSLTGFSLSADSAYQATCAEGFTEGHAKIKLFEQASGKVGLLVAGYSAADTRRASTVLARSAEYATELTGTEVDVSGTSLTDITVAAPVVPAPVVADETPEA